MSLTRKHYEQFAQRFNEINTLIELDAATDGVLTYAENERVACHGVLRGLAYKLGTDFLLDNPRFDRQRFMTACGF